MMTFYLPFIALLLLVQLSLGIEDGEKEGDGVNPHAKLYSQHMREKFEQSFHDKCTKYPFVQQWVNKLENPGDKYYTFIFQESHLKSGGLGDRIGGLLTAMGTALRTNRTLLITSENQFHELFRPYHPTDIKNSKEEAKYTWEHKKWKKWTNWDPVIAGNDATELDLWYVFLSIFLPSSLSYHRIT
jgi:hypothetical protein